MTEKPQTRAQLEAQVGDLLGLVKTWEESYRALERKFAETEKREKETRAQFDDLKTRLVTAEADNQRMRGYITRVQEDDVVREELVTVGDPGGEQRLVPKRKPEPFHQPSPYSVIASECNAGPSYVDRYTRERTPPKHWITY